jgi:hypothetical protein
MCEGTWKFYQICKGIKSGWSLKKSSFVCSKSSFLILVAISFESMLTITNYAWNYFIWMGYLVL